MQYFISFSSLAILISQPLTQTVNAQLPKGLQPPPPQGGGFQMPPQQSGGGGVLSGLTFGPTGSMNAAQASGVGNLGGGSPLGVGGGNPGGNSNSNSFPAPSALPTINIAGGGMNQGGGGLQQQQMQQQLQQMDPLSRKLAEVQQDPKLDTLCPSLSRKQTAVGESCWKILWTYAGCKPENVPPYEDWHNAQSLEILAIDAVTWANTKGSERHEKGCYGSEGPPPSLSGGGGQGMGMMNRNPMSGSFGSGSIGGGQMPGFGGGGGGLPGGNMNNNNAQQQMVMQQQQMAQQMGQGGQMGMQQNQQPQMPQDPQQQALQQAISQALQTLVPQLVQACQKKSKDETNVGQQCWALIWQAVGCEPSRTPEYTMDWHAKQSLEVLSADAASWAALPSEKHRMGCYGKMEL